MSQTHDFQTNSFKYLLLNYLNLFRLALSSNPLFLKSNTSLFVLLSQIKRWNIERISNMNVEGLAPNLTLDDVNTLKHLIQTAINKSQTRYPEVFYDQLVFMCIGAIQVQSQTGSDDAWKLIEKFIQRFLKSQNDKPLIFVALITTIFVAFLSVGLISNTKVNKTIQPFPELPTVASEGAVDPVAISLLLRAYNKINIGTCQPPHSAMLSPEQKQALLTFANYGVVEIQHVENLRNALDYVNCLYPSERLHPEGSTGNRL